MSISIIVPMFNERENVRPFYAQFQALRAKLPEPVELIFVDDGSRDGTAKELDALAEQDEQVKVVRFRRNFGQTAAMQAGIHYASHAILVTLDGDLQNELDDIPMMIAKLGEGYDLVHGWRKQRQDTWLNRKLPSEEKFHGKSDGRKVT